MMCYIQSEPSSGLNNEITVVTATTAAAAASSFSSPDAAILPRPTTLSSFLSSLSCQSYGSIGSCTSFLYRASSRSNTGSRIHESRSNSNSSGSNSSGSRSNSNSTDDYYYDSKNRYFGGTDVSSVLPSILRAWNESDIGAFQSSVPSSLLPPPDNDYDVYNNQNDQCCTGSMIQSNSDISTCMTRHQPFPNEKMMNSSTPATTTTSNRTSTTSTITTAIIIPTIIPRPKPITEWGMSRKCKEVVVSGKLETPRMMKQQRVKVVTTSESSKVSTKRTRKIKMLLPSKTTTTETATTTITGKKRKCRSKSSNSVVDTTVVTTGTKRTKKGTPSKTKSSSRERTDHGSDTAAEEVVDIGINDDSYWTAPPLYDWQIQFLNFMTYPSDHIDTMTGTKISLRDTLVWGRQKVRWTTALPKQTERSPTEHNDATNYHHHNSNNNSKEPLDVSSNVIVDDTDINNDYSHTKREDRPRRGIIPAKAGGNHLSQQLFFQAALVTAHQQQKEEEDQEEENNDNKYNIRNDNVDIMPRTSSHCIKSEVCSSPSIWSRVGAGGHSCISDDVLFELDDFDDFATTITTTNVPPTTVPKVPPRKLLMIRRNEEQALWFHGGTTMNQTMGEWLQKERESYKEHHLEKLGLREHRVKQQQSGTKVQRCKRHLPQVKISRTEMEERYQHIQRSFQYHLLELSGMDMQTVQHDATMFYGKYHKE